MRQLTPLTSSMTEQMCLTHWVMACGVPEMVTALSVESGSMSPATWTWAPVVLILPDIMRKQRLLSAEKSPVEKQLQLPPKLPPWNTLTSREQLQNQIAAYASILKCLCTNFFRLRRGYSASIYTHNQWHFPDQQARKTHFLTRLRKSLLTLLDTWSTRFMSLCFDFVKKNLSELETCRKGLLPL